jgi:hypothetical protein
MHTVKIISYTSGTAKELAMIRLDADGNVAYDGNLPSGLREVIADAYDRAKSPTEFMLRLPKEFLGTYIRAVRVKHVSPTGGTSRKVQGRAEWDAITLGGPGSGNFGHAGRPGERGGSSSEGAHGQATGSQGRDTGREGRGSVSPSAATSTKARPDANADAQAVANTYNEAHGRPTVDHGYAEVDQARARTIADAYDVLPVDDRNNPQVKAAYAALTREIDEQWDHAVQSGMTFEPWEEEGQPYQTSSEMAADVKANKHLYFYTGGNPHPLLDERDPETGLSANDRLRAIHDYYGHAAGGYGFGPRGEENAWIAHSQMFSPNARRAMTTETRGQNSWVNFGRQNYAADGTHTNTPLTERAYATQKVALLPDEFVFLPGQTKLSAYRRRLKNFNLDWDEALHLRDMPAPPPKSPKLVSYREKLRLLGGPGSGNFGHAGRPGERGGSAAPEGGMPVEAGPVERRGGESGLTTTEEADYQTTRARMKQLVGQVHIAESKPTATRAAAVVADVLEEMKGQGYRLPESVMVGLTGGGGIRGQMAEVRTVTAGASTERHLTIDIPEQLPDDANLDDAVAAVFGGVASAAAEKDPLYSAYDKFAVRTMKDVVVHEMAHTQAGHRGMLPLGKLLQSGEFTSTNAIARAMRRVSEYASKNQDEFLAEAFTRLRRGETLPEDSMKLYKALDGPPVKS